MFEVEGPSRVPGYAFRSPAQLHNRFINLKRSIALRDLLALVGVFALALSAMRFGGLFSSATLFLLFCITALRAIVATSDSDERVGARGFVIPILLYSVLLGFLGDSEFGVDRPRLFSSQILAHLGKGTIGSSMTSQAWEFMALGHAIVAITIGAIGSFFAVSLDAQPELRREIGEPDDARESPN